jgi:predicted RNA-binding protein
MESRNYWLDLFSGATWGEFLEAGAEVSGFRRSRWKTVQKIKRGDCLLCYLTRVSRWMGVLEVISEPFEDSTPIWKGDPFPCRMKVKPLLTLTTDTGVPVVGPNDPCSAYLQRT